ncbi:MAG: MATE family efflux transporter [Clostridium sp.]|nr:MATE family efflux transporter [Clostridium sp.]
MVLTIVAPMVIQNAISNFVSMLDNIMVGRMGTEQMSGVAICNQLLFIVNLCIFGAVSGVGIFTAQFYGARNYDGVRQTFQLKLIIITLITILSIIAFVVLGDVMIEQFLKGEGENIDAKAVFRYGMDYLLIMMVGLLPFAWSQCIESTLRECGETVVPMYASMVSMATNFVMNCILIFGMLGAPRLGAVGAAIATVISRIVELVMLLIFVGKRKNTMVFFQHVFTRLHIPRSLVRKVIITGTPLLVNETIWSASQAVISQCYSTKGLEVVPAFNIANTINGLFIVVYLALGSSIAIIVGQQLGNKEMENAVDTARKLRFFSVSVCFVIGVLLALTSRLFPLLYNTSEVVRHLASQFMIVQGLFMPLFAYEHATYFTLRSGGKTMITLLFDCVFVCVVNIPVTYMMCNFTSLAVIPVFALCQTVEFVKAFIGYLLIKKGIWIHNIVES